MLADPNDESPANVDAAVSMETYIMLLACTQIQCVSEHH